VDAVTDSIRVQEPVLVRGFRFVPPGATFEVSATLRYGDRQLLPQPPSDRTLVPGTAEPVQIGFVDLGTPYEVTLRAFAPNADFAHTVKAQVDTLSVPAAQRQGIAAAQLPRQAIEVVQSDVTAQDLREAGSDS
jgi:hypothetical protein